MVAETPDPLEQDYRTVFRSEAGEKVLRHLMSKSFIWEPTQDKGFTAMDMANREGQRMVVLGILSMIRPKMEKPTEYADEAGAAEQDYQEGT